MKQALKRWLCRTVAAAVLLSSSGVVLASHTCLRSSSVDVSVFTPEPCCPSEKSPCGSEPGMPSVKGVCCLTQYSYHKSDSQAIVSAPAADVQAVGPPATLIFASSVASGYCKPDFFPVRYSCPRGGKALSAELHRWRI